MDIDFLTSRKESTILSSVSMTSIALNFSFCNSSNSDRVDPFKVNFQYYIRHEEFQVSSEL